MSSITVSTTTKSLLVVSNLIYSLGSFIADFNETHVLNPRWPPHAKFHNGQTMSLSVLLCSMSLYLAFRPATTIASKKGDLWLAALVGSFYCTAGLSAILYPGTSWNDPEYPMNPEGGQGYLFAAQIVITWIGYAVGSSTLSKSKVA